MTARQASEPRAGHWVAYYTTAEDYGHSRRIYLRRHDEIVSWSVFRSDALRFDKKAEAERVVRQLRPKVYGQRTGAEKVTDWP